MMFWWSLSQGCKFKGTELYLGSIQLHKEPQQLVILHSVCLRLCYISFPTVSEDYWHSHLFGLAEQIETMELAPNSIWLVSPLQHSL